MSTNNHIIRPIECQPVYPDEWETVPERGDVKGVCGWGSLVTIYNDSTVEVSDFHCYRWDCERCLLVRKEMTKELVLGRCSSWPVAFVSDEDYVTVKRQMVPFNTRFCIVGTRDLWLFFTEKQVLEGSRVMSAEALSHIIDLALSGPHDYKRKSFSYTVGLFEERSKELDESTYVKIVVALGKERAAKEINRRIYAFVKRDDDVDPSAITYIHKKLPLSTKKLTKFIKDIIVFDAISHKGPLFERRR